MIDDISPLYELDYDWSASIHLFTPKPAYLTRGRYGGKSKTRGENHPAGAIINYYLSEVNADSSTYVLKFLDSKGKVLKRFCSGAEKPENKWAPKEGANRFIWDLRTSGVDKVEGMILWAAFQRGPKVVPGTYQVRLIANGDSISVPLEVKVDPRFTVSQDDLEAQYDFLTDIRNNMNRINTTIREIRDSRKKLNGLKDVVEDSNLLANINTILDKGKFVEESLYQTRNKSPQDPLNFPIRLNNKYGHLGVLADWGYNRPTQQMFDVKEAFEKELDKLYDDWDGAKKSIETLNEALHKAKVPYVEVKSE
jgi:archaellum component FlaC